MKLIQFVIFTMTSFFVICIWIAIISSFQDEPVVAIKTGGTLIDLQADYDSTVEHLFEISGFEYFSKIPTKRVPSRDRMLRRATKLWAIHGVRNGTGSISLDKLQSYYVIPPEKLTKKKKGPPEPADVVVVITYYISSDEATSMSVVGINNKTNEQTMEMLNSITEPAMMCTRIVYLGPVDKVIIEGYAKNTENYVVVDELKIAIGVDHQTLVFEDEPDMSCRSS